MKGISRKLVELVGSEWMLKENIVIWVIYHRSSAGYYNYKNVAILVTMPSMDKNGLYEEDSRRVLTVTVDTGAYQEFSNPKEVISAIKYIARKYGLQCRVIKLDWYYHFVGV